MNLDNRNFWENISVVKKAIRESDFIAFDTEFSGIQYNRDNYFIKFDDIEDIYQKVIQACLSFTVLQFGLSTLKWDPQENQYRATAFNFYLSKNEDTDFPSVFSVQNKCFRFLSENQMDFQRVFQHGIGFQRISDLERLKTQPVKKADRTGPRSFMSSETKTLIAKALQEFEAFLKDKEQSSTVINCYNQFIVKKFKGYSELRVFLKQTFGIDLSNLPMETVKDQEWHLKISKPKKFNYEKLKSEISEQKEIVEEEKNDHPIEERKNETSLVSEEDQILGFSNIIKELIASGKPLIGHNLIFDLTFLVELFVQPIPETYQDFRVLIKGLFPVIFDTKVLANDAQFHVRIETNVEALHRSCKENENALKPFCNVVLEEGYDSYESDSILHEAGFDAYATGCVFVSLLGLLNFVSASKQSEEQENTKGKKSRNIKGIENAVASKVNFEIASQYENMITNPIHQTWKFEDKSFAIAKHVEERFAKFEGYVLFIKFDTQTTTIQKIGDFLNQFGDLDLIVNTGDELFAEYWKFSDTFLQQKGPSEPIQALIEIAKSTSDLTFKCFDFRSRRKPLAKRLLPLE